jgi:histidyl-tRNA synthetase
VGIKAEIYPDAAKMKKQFNYADKKQIPYVMILGSEEIQSGQLALKDMKSGEQKQLPLEEAITYLKEKAGNL